MVEKDRTVLIIDDELLILTIVSAFLRKSRFHALTAADWQTAFAACTTEGRHIDIVLNDVSLPSAGREEFWAEMNARFPHARQIAMSGFLEDQATGFFLQKPFKAEELIAMLEQASQPTLTAGSGS